MKISKIKNEIEIVSHSEAMRAWNRIKNKHNKLYEMLANYDSKY